MRLFDVELYIPAYSLPPVIEFVPVRLSVKSDGGVVNAQSEYV